MRRAVLTKTLLGLLIVGGLALAGTEVRASEALTNVVNAYLQIQAQLALDKAEGLKEPARAIAAEAGKLGEAGTAIASGAKAVEDAADLEAARNAFGTLTDAVLKAGQSEGWKGLDVRLAYCPMVDKSWLQKESEIRNPYYGSQMLTCGVFKDLPR
jgi:Cu(I)/Ag(I) efflux system membrane fusion protein